MERWDYRPGLPCGKVDNEQGRLRSPI